jgi:succinate dehydrogenase / fumarate reductase, iron-sulfur subunit
MNFSLRIWRQQNATAPGELVTYQVKDVTPDMSFLEMLDALNEDLLSQGEPPVAFEHDCREGICGSCGFLINGVAHGGRRGTTTCQLSMRFFQGWRHAHIRAVARSSVPGDPRPDGESVRL